MQFKGLRTIISSVVGESVWSWYLCLGWLKGRCCSYRVGGRRRVLVGCIRLVWG